MKKDKNIEKAIKLAKLEKIREKYGEGMDIDFGEIPVSPEDLMLLEAKINKTKSYENKENISKNSKNSNLIKKDRTCPVCFTYSFLEKDDLYMDKFDCCFDCYLMYVESREKRWFDGWRPETK